MAKPTHNLAQPPITSPPSPQPVAIVNLGHPGHDSAVSLATVLPDSTAQPDDNDASDNYDGEEDGQAFDDNDSAFGGSLIGCDTETLASFITDYRYENGRRYHAYKDGEYWVNWPSHLCISNR